jgi:hypothetical protein
MDKLRYSWQRTPRTIRRPVVLTIGMLIVLSSGLIGWLPGPGGIPLFLLGIAILASEFHWANRLKVFILDLIHRGSQWLRTHRTLGGLIVLASLCISLSISYMLFYRR